jgi:N-acetylglutamate synthase-like GNAT family acetyltransferase
MRSRVARPADAEAICALIAHFAAQGLLLPRTLENIRACIGHFLVMAWGKQVVGCVALEPYGTDLVEVRSLAVAEEFAGRGLGARLLRFAVAVARRRGIARVFAVTHAPEFFARQGFSATERRCIPEKIARDCQACPKRRDCHLQAVVFDVLPAPMLLPVREAN